MKEGMYTAKSVNMVIGTALWVPKATVSQGYLEFQLEGSDNNYRTWKLLGHVASVIKNSSMGGKGDVCISYPS
jgi:hypothetical protein